MPTICEFLVAALMQNWRRAEAGEVLQQVKPPEGWWLAVLREIRNAYPVKDYHLILEFDTGEYKVVDLRQFLKGPVFEPLKDPSYFRQVKVDHEAGTVIWPSGADLDPDVLYSRSITLTSSTGALL